MTKKYREFVKRFIDGDQNIVYLKLDNKEVTEQINTIDKNYYWEENQVYNILKPVYESLKADKSISDNKIFLFMETLIPFQREYNNIKNRKTEYINRLSNGVLAVEDGSVDIDKLEDEGLGAGKIIVYRQGSRPPQHFIFTADSLIALQNIEDKLLKDFYDRVFRFKESVRAL